MCLSLAQFPNCHNSISFASTFIRSALLGELGFDYLLLSLELIQKGFNNFLATIFT